MISAVVLAKNEEKDIADCLDGLLWCDEILVIDDGSTDETIKLAEKHKAKVIKHPLDNDFAKQRNFAFQQAKNEWVFFVDADERVTVELANEIRKKINNKESKVQGYYFKRIDNFLGKWLRHGEIGGIGGYGGIKILRLARKETGEWKRKVDEIWNINGKTEVLLSPLLHYSHPSLTDFLISVNERSTLNAEQFFKEGKRVGLAEWLKPLVKFICNYFLLLGFLDGVSGFVFAVLMSIHSFLVRAKLYLLWWRKEGFK